MKITIKNNRNGSLGNELVKKIITFYLKQLLKDDVSGIDILTVTFKKLIARRGGSAGFKNVFGERQYHIILNSTRDNSQIFRTLAHECTHIKQYVTKELTFGAKYSIRGRRQTITTWKGRDYMRKAYLKQPWEIDARKGEKMAWNILNKIDAPVEVITKPEPVEVAPVKVIEAGIGATIANILKEGAILNADLVKRILNGDTDKQKTLKVLRAVFNSKTDGFIREVIRDSIVWVELV